MPLWLSTVFFMRFLELYSYKRGFFLCFLGLFNYNNGMEVIF